MRIHLIKQAPIALSSFPTFTVPPNTAWKILYGHSVLNTASGASARRWEMTIQDENGDVMSDSHSGATQGITEERHYLLRQGIVRETSFVGDTVEVPISIDLILLEGWSVTVKDENAVNGDDLMSLHLVILAGNLTTMLSRM